VTREAVRLGVDPDIWLSVGDKVHYDDAIWEVSRFEDNGPHAILSVVLESPSHGITKEPLWLVHEGGDIIERADACDDEEGSG
jgi:hypothetical protein